ncbi:MAG: hypothetical protein GF315_00825 [candidate division Zixibacteria bacterium]|nr:hypothetical protein [candidate division Zixibacteria bacterium]
MGTNSWEMDVPEDMMVEQALEFSEMLRSQGIAELQGFWIANDKRLLWCSWETDNLNALKEAFAEMNEQSGLTSELTEIKQIFPE